MTNFPIYTCLKMNSSHYITFYHDVIIVLEHSSYFVISSSVNVLKQPEVSMVTLYSIDRDVIPVSAGLE